MKLNMNVLSTEVNLGVGSKQASHLCFIKPIGPLGKIVCTSLLRVQLFPLKAEMGGPREEMV